MFISTVTTKKEISAEVLLYLLANFSVLIHSHSHVSQIMLIICIHKLIFTQLCSRMLDCFERSCEGEHSCNTSSFVTSHFPSS